MRAILSSAKAAVPKAALLPFDDDPAVLLALRLLLARALEQTDAIALELRAGEHRESVVLEAGRKSALGVVLGAFPTGTAVEVAGGAAGDVLVRVERRALRDGAATRGFATPLQVERKAVRVVRDASGAERRRPLAPGADGALRCAVGDEIESQLRVQSLGGLSYVVIEARHPAGGEVVGLPGKQGRERAHGDVDDEKSVFAIGRHSEPSAPLFTSRFVAGLEGRVAWPAATAARMYFPEACGASAGAWLKIEARPTRTDAAAPPARAIRVARSAGAARRTPVAPRVAEGPLVGGSR
ncbi:MAG: hypothetical protein EXS13_10915 [Planctomycetes bacterium]|nr:hypothetical protein [Planctomycetota bacterium]